MAYEQKLPPRASILLASMRDLGYTLEAAVADLIDNSISANATNIEIICDLTNNPTVAIIDNGDGMDHEELIAALRHGSTCPTQKRVMNDLGRFGLGLKTASLSQCKRLTVASAKNSVVSSAEWDLDLIDKKDDWIISVLDPYDIQRLPYVEKLNDKGTIILWCSLDRLFENETGMRRDEIVNEKLDVLERHLSLVFHRFLAGSVKGKKKISISINGHNVESFDPFCRNNTATQMLPEEIIWIDGSEVRMVPFILPHHSKLSVTEYNYYHSRSDFLSNQGAYIYRNSRLLAWGDWFRLIPKGEATKLARVQIDFPSSLDEIWTIDVKKSRAKPPYQVRERLGQVIMKIAERSTSVHRSRGKKLFEEIKSPIWERYADQNHIRYSLNRQHPMIQSLTSEIEDHLQQRLNIILDTIEASIPIEMIYSDYSTSPQEIQKTRIPGEVVSDRLKVIKEILFQEATANAETFMSVILSTRLFDDQMEIVEGFIRKEFT